MRSGVRSNAAAGPGAQSEVFGVLLRLMREDKVLGVYWKEQELEEEDEP